MLILVLAQSIDTQLGRHFPDLFTLKDIAIHEARALDPGAAWVLTELERALPAAHLRLRTQAASLPDRAGGRL